MNGAMIVIGRVNTKLIRASFYEKMNSLRWNYLLSTDRSMYILSTAGPRTPKGAI